MYETNTEKHAFKTREFVKIIPLYFELYIQQFSECTMAIMPIPRITQETHMAYFQWDPYKLKE